MRPLLLVLTVLATLVPAASARATALVEVPLSGPLSVPTLERLGFDVTHDVTDERARILASAAERRRLARAGFPSRVLIRDVEGLHARLRAREAAARARTASRLPSSRDTYRTPSEYSDELDGLAGRYTGLVRRVDLPGRSVEGRPLQGVEIASDVNRSDDGRPVFVVMGAHHAREWPSAEVNMEFALDLARNFGADPRITQLLDRVRVFVFPVINPDGFLVSRGDERTVPPTPIAKNLQRKNCQVDASGPGEPCALRDSVDLNRNYGAYWGGNGASARPEDDTYRGPGPFSEPESRAVHAFSQGLHVMNVQSIHNIAALVLRPPGFQALGLAPDEARLKELGDRMGRATGYASEYGYELYEVTGATEDWNYVAQNAFGYTIELGGAGELPGTFQGPYQTHVVEQYLGADESPEGGDGVREALLLAGEQAGDTRDHSVLAGTGVAGATLRLTKTFKTMTSPICSAPYSGSTAGCGDARTAPFAFDDRIDTRLTVPASGRFTWHVNPSTRPFERKAGRVEAWTLTCTAPGGRVLAERQVVIGIGERRTVNACVPPAPGSSVDRATRRPGFGFVVARRQRRSTVLRRGVLVRTTCPAACTVRTGLRRPGSRRPRVARTVALGSRTLALRRAGKARPFRIRLSPAARREVRRGRLRRLNVRIDARTRAARRLEALPVQLVR